MTTALFISIIGTAWMPGPASSSATRNFVIDRKSRADILSFYNNVYLESEDYLDHVGWTGNYSNCTAGSTSEKFQADMERRINYYRAMAGVPSNARLNNGAKVNVVSNDTHKPDPKTTRQRAAEQTALMLSWNNTITHNPTPSTSYVCWSAAAWNGAKNSSLTLGFFGPQALDAYMRDNDPTSLSIWDAEVGHRRWLLFPRSTEFANGEAPGNETQQPVNVLYVVPGTEASTQTPSFTSWPSSGFFPRKLTPLLWSLSYPGADFTDATVSMSEVGGASIPVTIIARNGNFGDRAIIWQVPKDVVTGKASADQSYQITVDRIKGGGPSSYRFATTLFDVNTLGRSWGLVGTSSPPTTGANYVFDPLIEADEYIFETSEPVPSNWLEGAESGTTAKILDQTSSSYSLFSNFAGFFRTGSYSFRMGFPVGNSSMYEEIFGINRSITPGEGSQVQYFVKRGWMLSTSRLELQYSSDDSNWISIDTISGNIDKGMPDKAFSLRSVNLPQGSTIRLRFRFSRPSNQVDYGVTASPQLPIGIFVDDISVTNATEPTNLTKISLPAGSTSVKLDEKTAGQPLKPGRILNLNLKARIGYKNYSIDSVKMVKVEDKPVDTFEAWKLVEYPTLKGSFIDDDDGDGVVNGMEYALRRDPTKPEGPVQMTTEAADGILFLSVPLDIRPGMVYEGEHSMDLEKWIPLEGSYSEGKFELKHDFGKSSKGYLRLKVRER